MRRFATPIVKTLLTEHELRLGVERMAAEINRAYQQQPLTIVGVLTGSVVLLADLIRLLEMPLRVGVIQASSYRGMERGDLTINTRFMPEISGRNVLLVDDIFDTGHTLVKVIELVRQLRPSTVESAVLLRKIGRQEVAYRPQFVGFEIPDEFVVGYGLDYQDAFRNLPYVAALEACDLDTTAGAGGTAADSPETGRASPGPAGPNAAAARPGHPPSETDSKPS